MVNIKGFFIFVILIGLLLATGLRSESTGPVVDHGKKYSPLAIRVLQGMVETPNPHSTGV